MDVGGVATQLDRCARPAIVLPTHLHGTPAVLAELRQVADTARVLLVEDCAMAQGAQQHGVPVGTVGDVAIFSFGLGKVVSAGFGGAVVADDALTLVPASRTVGALRSSLHWVSRAGWCGQARFLAQEWIKRLLRLSPPAPHRSDFVATRLSPAAADCLAYLLADPSLATMLDERRRRSEHWRQFVVGLDSERVRTFAVAPGDSVCFPGLPLLVNDRESLRARLWSAGVDTACWFDYCAAAVDGATEVFPHAQWIAQHILLVPMDPTLDRAEGPVRQLLADYARGN